ncbi:MAG TPA: sigma-70 family RNA polymerase sigma factor [Opitutales bacterium]|nr:sigma-70 family RNA polymerase sigma factor [Opitutales bacterium]
MSSQPVSEFPDWTSELARLHDQPLRRYAYSLCRDWDMAGDAVQNTWLRFFRADKADVEPKIPAWLFLVCRRQVVDFLRGKGRMVSDDIDDGIAGSDAAPSYSAEMSDASRALFAEVDKLPPAEREVLRLKFQSGLSYAEIASVTDRSVNAVGVLLHTAMATLRKSARLTAELSA